MVVFAGEHHADLLPWLRGRATVLPVPASPGHALDLLDAALTTAPGTVGLVAVTGASNVTGEIWPYPEITEIAHRHGGSVAAAEHELVGDTAERLAAIPGVRPLRMWASGNPRIGVLPFTVEGLPYAEVAAALSAEYGIGVRHGCFCAHPLVAHLLDVDAATLGRIRRAMLRDEPLRLPGAVRASVGLATNADDLDRLVDALTVLTTDGPRWTYRSSPDGTDCRPDPDPRPWPRLPVDFG